MDAGGAEAPMLEHAWVDDQGAMMFVTRHRFEDAMRVGCGPASWL